MPSATKAESLVGVQEVIDGPHSIDVSGAAMSATGFAVKARAAALPTFPPMGPPDMLYVRKRYIPVVGPAKLYGYYHFVRGVDVSQVAAISAYIVDVVRNKGLDPQSWVSAGGWEIASATFLSYNFIAKADAIVHVDFPGSTTATAVDSEGRDIVLSDEFWSELLVSSVVRDIAGVGEQPLYSCLRVISPFTASRLEPLFLDAAADCAHRWHLAGIDTLEATTDFPSRSRIATTIRDYFLSHGRYDAAIQFFKRDAVREADAACVVHAAAAARGKGDLEQAKAIIDDLIATAPESELAWIERANILRASGALEKALEAAKTASAYADNSIDVWIVLAELYVDLKQHSKAFESLNTADMPPPALDPFLRELVPNRKNTTNPVEGASQGADAIRVLANRFREEKNKSSEKTDDTLAELPGKLMTDSERRCYAVLVKILNDLSWDEMLAVRGTCFVMETDVDNSEEVNANGSEASDEDDQGSADASGDSPKSGPNGLQEIPVEDLTNDLSEVAIDDGPDGDPSTNGDGESDEEDGADLSEVRLKSFERIGKKVCKPWLDYLVTNMYQDLRAMAMWNAEEQQFSAAAALHAAAMARKSQGESVDGEQGSSPFALDDIENQELENDYRRTASEVASTTKRPPTDWLRRGELALRLEKIEEARTAYWTAVKLAEKEKDVAISALCRVMKLASDDGDTKTTVRCADTIWNYVDANADRKQSSEPTAPVPGVRTAVFCLISKKGLRAVRDIVTSKVEVDRKRMERLLLDSVAFQVDGFAR